MGDCVKVFTPRNWSDFGPALNVPACRCHRCRSASVRPSGSPAGSDGSSSSDDVLRRALKGHAPLVVTLETGIELIIGALWSLSQRTHAVSMQSATPVLSVRFEDEVRRDHARLVSAGADLLE
jgi:hypothetical protein